MFNRPRQLITSGTAMAAVAGALLLGAEDAGLGPYTRAHVGGVTTSLWEPDRTSPSHPAPRRTPSERHHAPERH